MSTQQTNLKAIADAIRTKDGTAAPIKANDFPQRIINIPSGGGEDLGSGNIRVDFLYIDPATGVYKTVTKRCNKGDTMTAPNATEIPAIRGVCPALTFQGWNYNLSELNNIQEDLVIGALYNTTDRASWFKIRVTKTSGTNEADALNQVMYLNKSDTSTLTFRVEDMDGTLIESEHTFTNTGNFNIPFSLPTIGDYWVKIKITSGSGTYDFGNGTSSSVIFGGSTASKRQILKTAYVGNSVKSIGSYAFGSCYALTSISIPQGVTSIGDYTFYNCFSLTSITITNSVTSMSDSTFRNCYSLTNYDFTQATSIPSLLNMNAFTGITASTLIVVPDNLYSSWITATNWATYANYIISKTDYDNTYGN